MYIGYNYWRAGCSESCKSGSERGSRKRALNEYLAGFLLYNDLSSALKRRFNTVVLPLPDTVEEEVDIVQRRVESLGRALELPAEAPALEEIKRIVTIFRELRAGITADGKTKIKSPSGTLSTAEAISVVTSGIALAAHFGDGYLGAADVAGGIVGAVVKDPVQDRVVWLEYLETVVKERDGWKDLYRA
jgi:hypothetical protein